jgi:hypothetical protein
MAIATRFIAECKIWHGPKGVADALD